jgi:hypothetical protein
VLKTHGVSEGVTVRKGVEGSQEHPPCSAFVRVGNLWGEIKQTGSFIGPSAHRLTWGVLLTSFNPLSYLGDCISEWQKRGIESSTDRYSGRVSVNV